MPAITDISTWVVGKIDAGIARPTRTL